MVPIHEAFIMFKTTMYTLLERAKLVHVGHQEVASYSFDDASENERERLINQELQTRNRPIIEVETESGLRFRFLAHEVFTFGEDGDDMGRAYDTLAEEDVFVMAQDQTQSPWQG